jgi:GAF domain-containing protein
LITAPFVVGKGIRVMNLSQKSYFECKFSFKKIRVPFKLTKRHLSRIKEDGAPKDIITTLESLKFEEYATEDQLVKSLEKTMGKNKTDKYKSLVLKNIQIGKCYEWYILRSDDLTRVIENINNGKNCAVIGTRKSQKSLVLNVVRDKIKNDANKTCIMLDLREISLETDENFICKFKALLKNKLQDKVKPFSGSKTVETSLQELIQKYIDSLDNNLILLIDHLECIRKQAWKILLDAFQSVYPEGDKRLVLVIAISLKWTIFFNESPFFIKDFILMEDLDLKTSKEFINYIFKERGIAITPVSCKLLIEVTSGDRYLLSVLCNYTADLASIDRIAKKVNKEKTEKAISSFFDEKADFYLPLQESIQTIESNPVNLLNILKILEQGQLEFDSSLLYPKKDVFDILLLTEAVKLEVSGTKEKYSYIYTIRNKIYERYLKNYFQPEKVVYILTSAGKWKETINYLEGIISRKLQNRWLYLGTIVNNINAVQKKEEACELLIKALKKAFGFSKVKVFIENDERTMLESVPKEESERSSIALGKKDHPVIKAFFSNNYVVTRVSDEKVLLVQLRKKKNTKLGIVAIFDFDKVEQQDIHFLKLLDFLKGVGLAIGNIVDREFRMEQLKTLYQMGLNINCGYIPRDEILKQTVENIIKVSEVKAANIILFHNAYDPSSCFSKDPLIHIMAGFQHSLKEKIELRSEDLTHRVLETKQPQYTNNKDDINEQLIKQGIKACLCLPIFIHEIIIGVLYLNYDDKHIFLQEEIKMFSLFANQVSAALEKAHHVERLESLHKISTELVSKLDLEDILKSIAVLIVKLLNAERSLFLIIDMEHRRITQKTGHHYPEEHLDQLNIDEINEIMNGASGKVMKTGVPLIHPNAQSEEVNTGNALDSAKKYDTGPIIVVPLKVKRKITDSHSFINMTLSKSSMTAKAKEEVIGTLTACRKAGSPVFTNEDLDLACMLANQAAVAIDNAQLFQQRAGLYYVISHQLKATSGTRELIIRAIDKERQLSREELNKIADIIGSFNSVIDDLCQFSIVENGKIGSKSNFFVQDIGEIAHNVIRKVKRSAADRIKHDIYSGFKARVDGKKLEHAIFNLLDNAIKYSKPNSKIQFILKRKNKHFCQIKIINQLNSSIEKKELKSLFNKFVRGSNAKYVEGTGLGLYIVNEIVKLHRGEIKPCLLKGGQIAFELIIPNYTS